MPVRLSLYLSLYMSVSVCLSVCLCLSIYEGRSINKHIVQVCSNICSISQQASECLMQRTMLAAVQATTERLIVPRYLMGQMTE